MDQRVAELLNEQINKEFYSAYLYLDMANFYKEKGLDGYANWYEIQAKEEQDHAMLFYQYLHNNNQKVTLEAIAKPDQTYSELMDPLKAALAHEEYVTSLINNIYGEAQKVNDFRTVQFLDWFVKEQGEEEATAKEMVKNMELFGTSPQGLYALDREYAARTFTAPAMPM